MIDKWKAIKFILRPLYRFIIRTEIISSQRYRILGLHQDFNRWKRMNNYRNDNICKSRYEIFKGVNKNIIKDDPIDYL